jgi:hypothetical protein
MIAGWRGGQVAALAVSLLFDVVILRAAPDPLGVVLAIVLFAAGVGVATWPVMGRTPEEWAPDLLRHLAHRLRGGVEQLADPRRGFVGTGPTDATARVLQRALRPRRGSPGAFGALELLEAPFASSVAGRGAMAGVVVDRRLRTYTAALGAGGKGFVLAGRAEQERRVASWAGVLSALAREGSLVHRVQWVERSFPDGGAAVRQHLAQHAAVSPEAAERRFYTEFLHESAPNARRHEVLVVVSIHAGRCGPAIRAANGGDLGASAVLLREVAAVSRQLRDADVDVQGVLDPAELSGAIRRAFETDERLLEYPGGRGWASAPWPTGVAAEWSRLRADGTWHAAYWVAEWPRVEVGADFLGPLLLCSDVRRSLSVTMEPLSPLRAARGIEQRRTADIADAELRRRGGFLSTARRQREEATVREREEELAAGHGLLRFSGHLVVTAEDPSSLEEACRQLEQAAGQSSLELRRCYGDQLHAFSCGLPLARGLD